MKKFYNRQDEIEALLDIHQESQQQARFTYITGQRRIGKTSLINHVFLNQKFTQQNRVLYFFVERKSPDALLLEFTDLIRKEFPLSPAFSDFSSFFKYLIEQATQEPLTIIFDEFQNFDYVDSSIFSTLQKLWDQNHQDIKLNLLAVGSIYSSMEKIFADKHEPLFGRPTDKLTLRAFNLTTLLEILNKNRVQQNEFAHLLKNYTLFNGIPQYWDLLENKELLNKKPETIFLSLFLSPRSILLNEGKELLMEEFGPKYHTYFSIIEAVASLSKVSVQKIAQRVGIESHHVNSYLKALNSKYNLIQKNVSVLNPSGRKGRYSLGNRFLRTWFRYIFANKSLVEAGNKEVLIKKFKTDFPSYQGLAFEELVLEILRVNYKLFPYEKWGSYWDKSREIDIVGLNKTEKKCLLGECKLSASNINQTLLDKMERDRTYIASILKGYQFKQFIFVADQPTPHVEKLVQEHNVGLLGEKQLLSLITKKSS